MAKRLTDKGKELIIESFYEGKTIDALAKEFDCTNSTIVRNLKRILGNEKYKELIKKSKMSIKSKVPKLEDNSFLNKKDLGNRENTFAFINDSLEEEVFTEITPLDYEIDNNDQKDLSSVPIDEVDFPKMVYMIVDKKIELEIKYLREYPEWQFLSLEDLNRKTIEIHIDLKIAKRICSKEQKVIKVPNTNVFKIVAPILLSKGITRIVSPDQLIAL